MEMLSAGISKDTGGTSGGGGKAPNSLFDKRQSRIEEFAEE